MIKMQISYLIALFTRINVKMHNENFLKLKQK
jgi:hypothetical protein